MKLNNKVYDILKWIVMIVLPALSAFYVALAPVWGWPYAEQVAMTISAVTCWVLCWAFPRRSTRKAAERGCNHA